jgi:branched-chain amino acid transport system substrate-binding protein
MTMRRRLLGITVALLVLVAAAACSSSPKSSTAGSSAAAAGSSSTSSTSGAPITVGVICSCSGPYGGNLAAAEDGYKAWVDSVNASGGINGHPIRLITEDDAATPGLGVSDAQTLVADHVIAIADISLVDSLWASVVQKANIPVVGTEANEAPFYTNPDFYPEGETQNNETASGVAVLKAAGATKMGTFYCDDAAVCAEIAQTMKADATKVGVPMAYSAAVSETAPNYTAQCLAAKQAGVTALDFSLDAPVQVTVAENCGQVNFHPIYSGGGESYGPAIGASSAESRNYQASFPVIPLFANTPGVQQMNAALDKYYPGLRANYQTTNFTELVVYAWVGGLLLADAVKAGGLTPTGTPSAAEIVKGLDSLKGDTLGGMAPPLTFTAGQTHGIACYLVGKIVNGVPSMGNNGHAICPSGSS